jgi:small subunit ribosomal protein S6
VQARQATAGPILTPPPRRIARATGRIILSNKGVIRDLKNWGTFLLTKPRRKLDTRYIDGHHFVMRFDCSPDTQAAVRKLLAGDPRMIRHGIVKVSNQTLPGHANVGPIQWTKIPRQQFQ